MMCAMGALGLVASLVGSLAWPVIVAGIILFFHQPLIKLIGRLKSAQVPGASFEFGLELQDAEGKADVAVSDSALIPSAAGVKPPSQITEEKARPGSIDGGATPDEAPPDQASASPEHDEGTESAATIAKAAQSRVSELSKEAEANPSFTVLRAWEILSSLLADYIGTVLPDKPKGRNPYLLLPELQKAGELTPSYIEAVQDVRRLRNAVAHGQHNPTPGEAIAYVETVQKLVFVGALQLQLYIERRNSLA
jgi:hypothetical protein